MGIHVCHHNVHWSQEYGDKFVPLEVIPEVKHDKRGILSMGRHSDPDSGKSSFSILLGPAPHLDMEYTIFGQVPLLTLPMLYICSIDAYCSVYNASCCSMSGWVLQQLGDAVALFNNLWCNMCMQGSHEGV